MSHSISIVKGSGTSDSGWLQVGWRFYNGYSRPLGYCERRPDTSGSGSYALTEYSVTAQRQMYSYVKNGTQQFECRINGATLRTTHQDWLGFTQGTWVPVQAEAHARHVQLGHVAPNVMHFTDTEKVLSTGSTWSQMNVNGVQTGDPVWNFTQPNADGFGVNTDASH